MYYLTRLSICLAIMAVLAIIAQIKGKNLPLKIIAIGLAAYALYLFTMAEAHGEIHTISVRIAEFITPKLQAILNTSSGKTMMRGMESGVKILDFSISILDSIQSILKLLFYGVVIYGIGWIIWAAIKNIK